MKQIPTKIENTKTVLGKKTLMYYVRLILILPIYFSLERKNRKDFDKFISGLITHTCEFKKESVEFTDYKTYYLTVHECKHYGCNIVHMEENLTEYGIKFYNRYPDLFIKGRFKNEEKYLNKHNQLNQSES